MSPATALSCRELVELVTEYFEDALPRRERRRFEQHIAACEFCTIYLEQMRQTMRVVGTLSEQSISPVARGELLAAFRDWAAG